MSAFDKAVSHAMLYEVGGFWDEKHPAVEKGMIDTPANRRAVGYVNDPLDRGGETKFGVAFRANPDIDVRGLTYAKAKSVYKVKYWDVARCEKLPPRVAILHFDGAVNHGPGRACKFLQQAVGVSADGIIGPATIAAVVKMGELAVCKAICAIRRDYYRAIIRNDPSQARFEKGWMRRIDEMDAFTTNPKTVF